MQLKTRKKHEQRRGKLSQPGLFPLKVQDDELEWKISLNYDLSSENFILLINDEPFDGMPYLAELTFMSPQNIEEGTITLNGEKLHEGWTQYTADTISDWRSKLDEPTTDVYINNLRCTTTDVLNSVFDFIGRTIDGEEGLKSFTIFNFSDGNKLEEWPLE